MKMTKPLATPFSSGIAGRRVSASQSKPGLEGTIFSIQTAFVGRSLDRSNGQPFDKAQSTVILHTNS